jgi:hypothetical protein
MKEKLTINKIFTLGKYFRIPPYQRAYSWERSQRKQFIKDLIDQPKGEGASPYYLGHYLFEQGAEQNVFLVIDGQQRLTTVCLFVSAVCMILDERSPDFSDKTEALRKHYLNGQFQSVEQDQMVFEELIRTGKSSEASERHSIRNLKDASRFFLRTLKQRETEDILGLLNVLQIAEVSIFPVHDKLQAIQIFTLQNDRGKALSQLEQVKAFLMYTIRLNSQAMDEADRAVRSVEKCFEKIYNSVESLKLLDEDAVVRHYNNGFMHGWGGPMDNLSSELNLLSNSERVERLKKYAKELQRSFDYAVRIQELAFENDLIADPIILNGYHSWPLLLKLMAEYGQEIILQEELLRDMEIALFKLSFHHGSTANYLINWAKGFQPGTQSAETLKRNMTQASKAGFRWRGDFDQGLINYFNGDFHYDSRTRYVLWKYENKLRRRFHDAVLPRQYFSIQSKKMEKTIEHIASQNGNYDEAFRTHRLHNIGNLLFMRHDLNAHLSDDVPEDKIKRLDPSYVSHMKVKEIIEKERCWTEKEILARKSEILNFIWERYRIKTSSNSETPRS